MNKNARIILSVIIAFSAIIMGACTNTSRPTNQDEVQEEIISIIENVKNDIKYSGTQYTNGHINRPV